MELNNIKSNVPLPIGSNLIYEQLNSDAKYYQNVILNAIQDIAVQSWAPRILLLQTLSIHNLSVKMSNNFNLKLFIGSNIWKYFAHEPKLLSKTFIIAVINCNWQHLFCPHFLHLRYLMCFCIIRIDSSVKIDFNLNCVHQASIKTVLNQLPNIVIHQIQTQIDQNGYKKAPYQNSLCHFSSVHRNLFEIKTRIYF